MANILIVTPYFRPAQAGGGGQVSVENLVDILADENTISVICNNHDFGQSLQLSLVYFQKHGFVNTYFFSLANFWAICKAIRHEKFDYIYFNSFFAPVCILFQLVFFFSNTPKIVSPKGEFYDGAFESKTFKKKFFLRIYKLLFHGNKFHATSNHEVGNIKKYFPIASVEVARDIPTFKNTSTYIESKKKENEIFKIIYSSRIENKKNLAYLPQLLRNVSGDVLIDIFGDIADPVYFENVIKDFNTLPSNISWKYHGRLNFDKARIIFEQYDLFVFPTLGENYGHVIYESLSCGCPILLTKDSTPWNDLDENGIGFNLDLTDCKSWIEKIEYFKKMTSDEREKISNLCMTYARSKTDLNNIINENKNLFKKIKYV